MNILHICANPKPTEESASKQIATAFFTALAECNPDFEVTNIDLYEDPPPCFSYKEYRAIWQPVFVKDYKPSAEEVKSALYAQEQGKIFNQADILVITTPMWNFSLPSILKAWIDQLLTPNVTFTISAEKKEYLHKIKKVVLLVASGGVYKENDPRDGLTVQLKADFEFIGIDDISIAWADGQNPLFFADSQERKATAIEAAEEIASEVADMIK